MGTLTPLTIAHAKWKKRFASYTCAHSSRQWRLQRMSQAERIENIQDNIDGRSNRDARRYREEKASYKDVTDAFDVKAHDKKKGWVAPPSDAKTDNESDTAEAEWTGGGSLPALELTRLGVFLGARVTGFNAFTSRRNGRIGALELKVVCLACG